MYSCECYASRGRGAAVRVIRFEAELWDGAVGRVQYVSLATIAQRACYRGSDQALRGGLKQLKSPCRSTPPLQLKSCDCCFARAVTII